MNQEELAAAVGVTRTTVSNWETGKNPPRSKLGRIRQVLDLDDAGSVSAPASGLRSLSDAELVARMQLLLAEVARRFAESAHQHDPLPIETGTIPDEAWTNDGYVGPADAGGAEEG